MSDSKLGQVAQAAVDELKKDVRGEELNVLPFNLLGFNKKVVTGELLSIFSPEVANNPIEATDAINNSYDQLMVALKGEQAKQIRKMTLIEKSVLTIRRVSFQVKNKLDNAFIVGKYTSLRDSYKSLAEALQHGCISQQLKLEPLFIDAENSLKNESDLKEFFHGVHGILVPGGFGSRGTEGKIRAIHFARTNGIPFLGICLGMQLAMVEYGRHQVGLTNSNSEEFTNEGDLVIHYMEGQEKDGPKGGNMRLGAYQCKLKKGSLAEKIYGRIEVFERHRHRLEVNNSYVKKFEDAGIVVSGRNDSHGLVEIIEIPDHPFFVACQFHPEFKSRPYSPHPLFKGFIESSSSQS